jgi:hypothetical protein
MYEISFDAGTRILTLRNSGVWNLAEAERYRDELAATLQNLRPRYPKLSVLSDSRELSILSKEVAAAAATFMDAEIMRPTGRTAVLVSRMLNKLQADRMADNPLVRVFLDESEARAWLAEASGD